MGILLKKTFPLYAVQVGDQVHVTRQVEQGREWQRKARKEHKPTAYKICRSWEGVKKFRQAVLTPLLVEKVRSKMRERLVEAFIEGMENMDEDEDEEADPFEDAPRDFRTFFISNMI